MTAPSREQKRTQRLREYIPLYTVIELSEDRLDSEAQCSVPLSPTNTNHVGIMHTGVLFSLAEATGGVAISLHRDLASFAVVAKHVAISYRRSERATGTRGAENIKCAVASQRERLRQPPPGPAVQLES